MDFHGKIGKIIVNQLFFALIHFRVFIFEGIFAVIQSCELHNWTMQE